MDIKVTFLQKTVSPLSSLLQVFKEKQKNFKEAEKQLDDAKHNLFSAYVTDQVKKRNLTGHIEAFHKLIPKNVVLKNKDPKRRFFLGKPATSCSACEQKTPSKIIRSWFSNSNSQVTFNLRYGDLIVSKDEAETLIVTEPLCLLCGALFCDQISALVEKTMKSVYVQNAAGLGKTVEGDELLDTEVIYNEMMAIANKL